MRLDESLFEGVRVDPNFDEIEKALMSVKGTSKVEFDYRPNDGVYKKPEDHFIVLIDEDTSALEDSNKEDFKLYHKNRREWKLGVVNKLKELGWKLEDPMEDNDSYLYLVVEKDTSKKEGFEYLDGTEVEVYSDYHKALKRAKELGLKEAEYGDEYGSDISYCYWNESGDRNDTEKVIAYYVFEGSKPRALTIEEREQLEKEKEFTFDNELRESLTEATNEEDKLFANLFTQYLDSETPYQKVNGVYDVEIYTDYRDELGENEITQILESDLRRGEFYDILWHAYVDAESEYRYDIEDGFKTWVKGTNSEINIDELEDWLSNNLYDYVDIHPDYNHFEEQGIKTILLLDTGDANYDFTLNPSYANNYKIEDDKASIVWLVEQQGHSKDELIKALEDEKSDNKFMQSVMEECYNTSSSMNALVFLGKLTLGQLLDVDNNSSVVVNKSAMCGLVDTWAGGGSLLGIELEKDVVVPSNIVYYFGADGSNGGYSIDSIYGLVGSVWKDVFTIKSTSSDVKESLTEKMWQKKVPNDLAKRFHAVLDLEDDDSLIEVKQVVDDICDWLEQEDEDLEWDVLKVRDAWDIVNIESKYELFDLDDEDSDYTNEDFVDEEIISELYDILDTNNIWMPLEFELDDEEEPTIDSGDEKEFPKVDDSEEVVLEDIKVEVQPNMEELEKLAKEIGVDILSPMQNGDLRLSGSGENLMKFYQEAEKRGLWKVSQDDSSIEESMSKIGACLDKVGSTTLKDKKFDKDLKESICEIKCALSEIKEKYFLDKE